MLALLGVGRVDVPVRLHIRRVRPIALDDLPPSLDGRQLRGDPVAHLTRPKLAAPLLARSKLEMVRVARLIARPPRRALGRGDQSLVHPEPDQPFGLLRHVVQVVNILDAFGQPLQLARRHPQQVAPQTGNEWIALDQGYSVARSVLPPIGGITGAAGERLNDVLVAWRSQPLGHGVLAAVEREELPLHSLSSTAPMTVEGVPSRLRVMAPRMICVGTPCCNARLMSTAPSRARASTS